MVSLLLLWSLRCWAGAADDLALASARDLPEAQRMAAFERLVSLGATDLGEVLRVSVDPNADARLRWVAVRVLGQVGGPQSLSTLLSVLKDDMPAMRVAAANALGDLGDATAVPPLIEALADPALLVRGAAADALGLLGDRRAVSPLGRAMDARDVYQRGTSLWVRRHYVDALGRIGDRAALPTLLRALDDRDPSVAEAAVAAMEAVAGFSLAEGRSPDEEREAWRRWASAEIKAGI